MSKPSDELIVLDYLKQLSDCVDMRNCVLRAKQHIVLDFSTMRVCTDERNNVNQLVKFKGTAYEVNCAKQTLKVETNDVEFTFNLKTFYSSLTHAFTLSQIRNFSPGNYRVELVMKMVSKYSYLIEKGKVKKNE